MVAILGAALIVGIAVSSSGKDTAPVPEAVNTVEQPNAYDATVVDRVEEPAEQVQTTTPSAPATKSVQGNSKKKRRKTPVVENTVFRTTTPLAYRILHGGDQVLYDIAAIADTAGGRLVDVHGKLYSPHSLNEARSFSQLYLVTPKATAADAHKQLTTRSGMSPYPLEGPTPPLSEGEFVFLIEAQL